MSEPNLKREMITALLKKEKNFEQVTLSMLELFFLEEMTFLVKQTLSRDFCELMNDPP